MHRGALASGGRLLDLGVKLLESPGLRPESKAISGVSLLSLFFQFVRFVLRVVEAGVLLLLKATRWLLSLAHL